MTQVICRGRLSGPLFKVLQHFSSGKISFFIFASLWQQDLKLQKLMFFFQKSKPTEQEGIIEKRLEKCWFVARYALFGS